MEAIRREARSHRALAWALWFMIPIGMVIWLGGLASMSDTSVTPSQAAAMLLGVGILGLAAAFARQSVRRRRGLMTDLARGTALVFEGIPSVEFGDKSQTLLIGQGLIVAGLDARGASQTVDVLESANRILRVNGRPIRRWVPANVVEIGSGQPVDGNYPRRLEMIEVNMRDGMRRRSLSESEKAELNRMWRRTSLAILSLGAVTLYLVVRALGYFLHPASDRPSLGFFVLAAGVVIMDKMLISVLPDLFKCRADARNGIVLIMEVPGGGDVVEGEFFPAQQVGVEALPLSGRLWTVEGQPAQWRRQAARHATR